MTTVSTPDIQRVGDVPRETISALSASGLVTPAEYSSGGRGKAHRWHLMTAVGLAAAGRLLRTDRSCQVRYAAKIVAAFESVDEGWLLKEFAAGRTHLVMVHQGRPLLDGGKYDWPDVRAIHEELLAAKRDG